MVYQGVAVRREWDLDGLIASWTLVDADQDVLSQLHGRSRLSCALMLKFFEIDGRFPRHVGEVPPAAVDYMVRQLGLAGDDAARFEVTGRSAERYRTQIRDAFRFILTVVMLLTGYGWGATVAPAAAGASAGVVLGRDQVKRRRGKSDPAAVPLAPQAAAT